MLDGFIAKNHGKPYGGKKGNRDYSGAEGRRRALLDAMVVSKARLAKPLARTILASKDPARRFPPPIADFLEMVGASHGLKQCEASKT